MAWQPIETAPVGRRVLLAGDGPEVFSGQWDDYAGRWMDDGELRRLPTHWAPLPEPPPGRPVMPAAAQVTARVLTAERDAETKRADYWYDQRQVAIAERDAALERAEKAEGEAAGWEKVARTYFAEVNRLAKVEDDLRAITAVAVAMERNLLAGTYDILAEKGWRAAIVKARALLAATTAPKGDEG